jgi:hypothetical protein
MKAHMTFFEGTGRWNKAAWLVGVLALAGCATEDRDDVTGSRLEQPVLAQGQKPPPPIEAGDIAIAAQLFSHDIRELPQVAALTVPQLVQFTGVTSIVRDQNGQLAPIDTEPYTDLLRDRLLLGDREKLRFVERQLPAFHPHAIHKNSDVTAPIEISSDSADYRVLAELRGHADANTFRIQMEFVDVHTGNVLLNEVYRIRQEAAGSGNTEAISDQEIQPMSAPPQAQPVAPAAVPAYPASGTPVPPVPGVDDQAPESSLPTHYNPPPPPQ